ncbi:CCA tRNA nucleotidyltransferase [Corynebacterium heidelbergense]|uniref:CCA tRNA nucleotidyltransferase n=1 Tax=Corynebacterium heidelbergense TaxID=2055947 RepID=UPI0026C8B6D8
MTKPAQPPCSPNANPVEDARLLATAWRSLQAYDPLLRRLASAFEGAGEELYLVGGSVRDAFLARVSPDVDFTTSARPQRIVELLRPLASTVWETGIDYGTVSALVGGTEVEITTFRADQYDGQSRNPEVTYGNSVAEDLVRRDFRVNAMALRLSPDGQHDFVDPLGGLQDAARQVLDTPDAPQVSFRDDPLRMLRACRFVSQIGFDANPRVTRAMREMAEEITRITAERVAAELNKLMLGAEPWRGLDLMVETGLAEYILPELPALKLTQDEHRTHKDVYAHSLRVLRNAVELERDRGVEPNLELRWAALMHDVGKPATRAFTESGAVTFYHHEVVGAKMVRKRLRALKFSKQHIADISQLVFLHMRFHGYGEGAWTDSAVRRYVADAGDLLPLLHLLVRADCTTRNRRKSERLQRTYDGLEERIAQLREQEDLAAVRPDLDGNEIMRELGVRPGPVVGEAWAYLKELRLDRGPLGREEALAELRAWWQRRQGE